KDFKPNAADDSKNVKPNGADSSKNAIVQKVSKKNFDKLKVGMTQKQLEDILGTSSLASGHDVEAALEYKSLQPGETGFRWSLAGSANRVRMWKEEKFTILAAFPVNPVADSKVVALYSISRDSLNRSLDEIGSLLDLKVTEKNFANLTV